MNPHFLPFLDAATPPLAGADQGLAQTFVMLAIGAVFFYFILWRPEQKRRKTLETQKNSLKVGDKVIAIGIVGKIAKIEDDTLILTMVDGSKIEVVKDAVSQVIN